MTVLMSLMAINIRQQSAFDDMDIPLRVRYFDVVFLELFENGIVQLTLQHLRFAAVFVRPNPQIEIQTAFGKFIKKHIRLWVF